jgi:hypothetical protein
MASAFAVPLMSTVESSQYVRGHAHTHSHQRSGQRLTRPFALPRIPSERLDPRSVNYNHGVESYESSQKRGHHSTTNRASFGANGSINAPPLYTNGQLQGISKRVEATTRNPTPNGTVRYQDYVYPVADNKTGTRTTNMVSKTR